MGKKHYLDNQGNAEGMCPLRYLQDTFGGKWKMSIICMLAPGKPLRNSVIKRRLGGITNAMLSQTLKELEASGIIDRKQFNEVPPHVEYSLTERGASAVEALAAMATWATEDMKTKGVPPACEKCIATC